LIGSANSVDDRISKGGDWRWLGYDPYTPLNWDLQVGDQLCLQVP
jgi:hypothetical protein